MRSLVSARRLWPVAVAAVALGCIYDESNRCGPHMVVSDVDACVCAEGYVLNGTECVSCPEHERFRGGGCVCDDGYFRPASDASCTPLPPSGLGAPCSSAAPCLDAKFSYCAQASNLDQYCTSQSCQTDADCPDSYGCTKGADATFCQRTPLGLTAPCKLDADCAGFEATLCDTVFSNSCIVQGCSLSQNDCFSGWDCCDASAFGPTEPVCVPKGQCP
jgi:hypothetical protein